MDAELAQELPDDVRSIVERPEEAEYLAQLEDYAPDVPWPTILFSIKESIYKAWFPRMKSWLDFEMASVRIATDGCWKAVVLHQHAGTYADLQGRWVAGGGLIVTGLAVPRLA